MSLEQLLEQLEHSQKTISETTGVQKHLHELLISIARKQQDQRAATERTLQRWRREQRKSE